MISATRGCRSGWTLNLEAAAAEDEGSVRALVRAAEKYEAAQGCRAEAAAAGKRRGSEAAAASAAGEAAAAEKHRCLGAA